MYPINLDLTDKHCAVIGGGCVAARKTRALLAARAKVTVVAPQLVASLAEYAAQGKIVHIAKPYREEALDGFFLVFCATDDAAANRRAAEAARRGGALVNVADASSASDFALPAQVRRGDLLLTVSTGGKSPAFARTLAAELAARYGEEYGTCLAMLERVRGRMKRALASSKEREAFWRKALGGEVLRLVREGKFTEAEAEIENAIGGIGTES